MANITAAYGWRTTVICIAAVVCVVLPVVALLLRDRPSDLGLMPYGETGVPKPAQPAKGNPVVLAFGTLREARAGARLLAARRHLFRLRRLDQRSDRDAPDPGLHGPRLFRRSPGATLLATMGVFNFIGTTSAGWLADRFDNRCCSSSITGCAGCRCSYLPFSFVDFYTMTLFAMFYGLDWFATVSPTVRILTNTFGRERGRHGLRLGVHRPPARRRVGGRSSAACCASSFGGYMEAFMLSGLLCLRRRHRGAVHRRRPFGAGAGRAAAKAA